MFFKYSIRILVCGYTKPKNREKDQAFCAFPGIIEKRGRVLLGAIKCLLQRIFSGKNFELRQCLDHFFQVRL